MLQLKHADVELMGPFYWEKNVHDFQSLGICFCFDLLSRTLVAFNIFYVMVFDGLLCILSVI